MNKKQNLLLWYFTLALVVLLIFGFNNGDLEKLNHTTFFILLLFILGSCSLITTRGVNGLDFPTIKLHIFPIIYILIYYIAATVFISEFNVKDLMYQPLSSSVTDGITPKARLNDSNFRFVKSNFNNWIVNRADVSIFIKSDGKPDELSEKVQLRCYRVRSEDTCFGEIMFDYKEVNWSWTLDKTYGRLSDSFPNLYFISALFCLLIYIPLGIAIVFLTSAKNHFNDKIPEHVSFFKRFAFFAITYTIGIIFFPFFLNSWFTKEKKRSLLDDFNDVVNSSSVGKSNADVNLAIELAHTELLCEVISKSEISKLANEISIEQIELSTNDLALVTALFFFSKVELKESLSDVQFLARLKLQEWIQAKSVNLLIAKTFEDTLYKKFK